MLALVFDRLLTSQQFPEVRLAESIQAMARPATAAADGAVFVAPFRERARAPRDITGVHRQLVEVLFCTGLLVREHDDPQGANRARQFDDRLALTETLLAGWQPLEGGFPVSLVGAEATSLGNGVSIYLQTWQVSRFLTGAIQQ